MPYNIMYYENKNGKCPFYEFVETRKIRDKAKIFSWLKLLEEQGPNLHRPYSDYLENGIYELRIKLSGDQIRVLYYFCFKDVIVITHSFIKRSDKVPQKEIRKSNKYKADFLNRYSEEDVRRILNEDI